MADDLVGQVIRVQQDHRDTPPVGLVLRIFGEAADVAGRVGYALAGLLGHDIDHGLDQLPRGEVLASAGVRSANRISLLLVEPALLSAAARIEATQPLLPRAPNLLICAVLCFCPKLNAFISHDFTRTNP